MNAGYKSCLPDDAQEIYEPFGTDLNIYPINVITNWSSLELANQIRKKIVAKRTSSKMVAVCSSLPMKIQLMFSAK